MDSFMDYFWRSTIFYTLDASSRYLQVQIDDRKKDKTALASHHGMHQFTRMPFGLKNALGTFQLAMDVIIVYLRWQTALTYMIEIVIVSKPPEELTNHVR